MREVIQIGMWQMYRTASWMQITGWSVAVLTVVIAVWWLIRRYSIVRPSHRLERRDYVVRGVWCVIVCVALMIPWGWEVEYEREEVDPQTIVQFVTDVSLSMAAQDVEPSRFDAAKELMTTLARAVHSYPIGVIHYARIPFVWSPLSTQTLAVIDKIEHTTLRDFPPLEEFLGTNIGDSLLLAVDQIVEYDDEYSDYTNGVIVLITDGDANTGADTAQVAAFANKRSIPIHIVAVGREETPIGQTRPYQIETGERVVNSEPAKLVSTGTLAIAEMTSGAFYRLTDQTQIPAIATSISESIQTSQQTRHHRMRRPLTPYALYGVAFLLFLLVVSRLYRSIRVMINKQ